MAGVCSLIAGSLVLIVCASKVGDPRGHPHYYRRIRLRAINRAATIPHFGASLNTPNKKHNDRVVVGDVYFHEPFTNNLYCCATRWIGCGVKCNKSFWEARPNGQQREPTQPNMIRPTSTMSRCDVLLVLLVGCQILANSGKCKMCIQCILKCLFGDLASLETDKNIM